MGESASALADELLARGPGELEELRVHAFEDDASARDEAGVERLCSEFASDLDAAAAALSEKFGLPARRGSSDDPDIPLNGVFRFAVWEVEGTQLYIAAAHETRGVPILLMLGTA